MAGRGQCRYAVKGRVTNGTRILSKEQNRNKLSERNLNVGIGRFARTNEKFRI